MLTTGKTLHIVLLITRNRVCKYISLSIVHATFRPTSREQLQQNSATVWQHQLFAKGVCGVPMLQMTL